MKVLNRSKQAIWTGGTSAYRVHDRSCVDFGRCSSANVREEGIGSLAAWVEYGAPRQQSSLDR